MCGKTDQMFQCTWQTDTKLKWVFPRASHIPQWKCPSRLLPKLKETCFFHSCVKIHLSFVVPLVRALKTRGGQDSLLAAVTGSLTLLFLPCYCWPRLYPIFAFCPFSPLLLSLLPTPKSILKQDPTDTDAKQSALLLLAGSVERFFNLN